ncbi:hypothetical protein COT75_00990 [Candidatus Beckwithbacteria bacterium CG10_big_fil_rev_8_21_14_0_10_34_10]|uniref:YoaR-like putative peptidoglycan binding domain-containing protein n=1 Tax=Candidatus Beckwithbacteria bacterium CG10_big_fil_rev_8_21_14_0_10_34_10 TaxID=1974495 RepID=A0A2H0WA49_9BACT|nr:MAG: hypothetical protein COT75_00990 [Candidatus Beckwithbacteria bacterium CG10_big_fil_rev_8_21_14_0_10_34_10]
MIQKLARKLQVVKKIKKKLKKIKVFKPFKKIFLLGFGFILFFALIALSFYFIFRQKIFPGVKVANINLSAQSQTQAITNLKQASLIQKKILKLKHQDLTWEIDLSFLNFNYLSEATSRQAFDLGRSGNFSKDLKDKIQALKGNVNLDFEYQLNQNLLETAIASIAAQIDVPPISPSIKIIKDQKEKKIEITTGKEGKKLSQKETLKDINHRLQKLLPLYINLPVQKLQSNITQKQAEKTKTKAEKLLTKEMVLSYNDNSWQLEDKELIDFLDFENDFDEEKIASFTAQIGRSVNRLPQNALFSFAQGRVIEFKPAKDGQVLNIDKTNRLIKETLKTLEEEENTKTNIDLPVETSQPDVKTKEVNSLGINERLSKGESWFFGSISSRIHNLKLAASLLNGLLIAPGETFSLNLALGDVSAQTGFQKAWVIKEGKTVLGDGGGVCQVSTTLFRAALNAGLPIIERRAHAYRVSYYEQRSQVGLDATVFSPSPDLKIKNDTPGHILIQTYTDTANMKLTFELYGTSDGRKATISPSRIWDQTPPPPDLYQDDPTLPTGVVKQIDWKAWGAKAAFDWKVVRGNEVLQERTFYSNYQPWQAIFLKGTAG